MKNLKLLALSTVAVASLSAAAYADNRTASFTSHHLVTEKSYKAYAQKLNAKDKLQLREYLDYQQREPCQNYRKPPADFVIEGCNLYYKPAVMVQKAPPVREVEAVVYKKKILADYDIHFAYDSYAINSTEFGTLDQVAHEIKDHNPSEVTVSGHTDTAGSSAYNIKLSENRAQSVSNALTNRGVVNRVLGQKAYGETNLEVPTADGVANKENRRVEIKFVK